MILRLALASLSTLVLACGGKSEGPAAPAPGGASTEAAPAPAPAKPEAKPIGELTVTLDIGAAVMAKDPDDTSWKGISIKAPEGAKLDVSPGGTSLVIDDTMSMAFSMEADIAEKKAKAEKDTLQGFKRFVVDTPDAILWETTDSNFIFVANVKLGEKTKRCETAGWGTFSQKNAEKLLEACKGMTFTAE